jgi:outer membrane protein assembly factor BamB
VAVFLCCSVGVAADWPQWLGPTRDAASTEVVAPWKESPKVLWRQPVGEGNSSPVVSGGRLFVHAKVKDKDEEEVAAYDKDIGKLLWRSPCARGPFKSLYGNGPRATPSAAGGWLFTFGITGVLTCFDSQSGKQVWQVDTLRQFKATNLFFGMACSPLVVDGRVLVNVGGKGASVVAFDVAEGKVAWQALDDRASYSSPIILGEGTERQVIFLTQQGLVSLNPQNGSLYWRFPLVDKLFESSTTPVKAGDLLMASSITYGSVGLRLETKEGKPQATQEWMNEALTCYFATPVAVKQDYLYVVTGTKPIPPPLSPKATLHCIEAKSGKELWQRPKVGKYHATLLRTGDDKLLMLEEAGDLVLLEPSSREYKELARSKVCGETWAHPALCDGRLYVRDDKEVICLQLGK